MSKKKASPAEFVPLPLEGRNDTQRTYLRCLRSTPMVFGVGPAGTGKTYLAAAYSIEELALDRIDRIILTRATVPVAGENIGLLPGGLDEKMAPWVEEIFDIFRERVGDQVLKQLRADQRVKIVPFAFMRGRSFRNSFILVDEAQNALPSQTKMLVTRIGEGSKMFINGDLTQSDLRGGNGLEELLWMVREQKLPFPVVTFTEKDVERSQLCRIWVDAYKRKEAA